MQQARKNRSMSLKSIIFIAILFAAFVVPLFYIGVISGSWFLADSIKPSGIPVWFIGLLFFIVFVFWHLPRNAESSSSSNSSSDLSGEFFEGFTESIFASAHLIPIAFPFFIAIGFSIPYIVDYWEPLPRLALLMAIFLMNFFGFFSLYVYFFIHKHNHIFISLALGVLVGILAHVTVFPESSFAHR